MARIKDSVRRIASTLRGQLAMAFGLMVLLALGLALTGWMQLAAIQRHFDRVVDRTLPTLAALSEVNDRLQQVRAAELQHLTAPTMPAKDKEEASVKSAVAAFNASVARHLERRDDAGDTPLDDALRERARSFAAAVPKFIAMSNSAAGGEVERVLEAREYFNGPAQADYRGADGALRQLWAHHTGRAEQAKNEGRRTHAIAQRMLLGAAMVSVLLSLVLAVFISRRVTRLLGGEPAEVAQIACRIAEGDLSRAVELRAGTQHSVMHSMQLMQQQLRGLIGEAQDTAHGILIGVGEIATGNQDLSRRTEEQASSLQSCTSTVEQMSAALQLTAGNARAANELAREASAAAQGGGDVVTQVVAIMDSIAQRSRHMADTLGVIERIAAQTNILALNAAVEAARAGDQGRGFAVVAGEVRALAQRSAAAAKEISALIADSATTTTRGVTLAQSAGQAMHDIVERVCRVDTLMHEVSSAIQEQSGGIAQVSQGIVRLEHTAQQNAALVEQSAAASGSLQSQTQRLVGAVSRFRLQPA
jgi:methyl-accepting chemotaxis protein